MLFSMRLAVVSCPATISWKIVESSSRWSRRSSPSRAAIKRGDQIVTRVALFGFHEHRQHCDHRVGRLLRDCVLGGGRRGRESVVRAFPSAARSAWGTPRSSQMTVNGNGNANDATRSTGPSGPWAAMPSSRSSTMACTCWRRRSMRRVENAAATRRRKRVWSGGSTTSMCRANAGPGRPSATTSPLEASAACMSFDSRGSLSAIFASA